MRRRLDSNALSAHHSRMRLAMNIIIATNKVPARKTDRKIRSASCSGCGMIRRTPYPLWLQLGACMTHNSHLLRSRGEGCDLPADFEFTSVILANGSATREME
jgi:hypothetical protein